MAAASVDFEEWLGIKLQDLNTDQDVFGGYITGILDSDDTNEEKLEALEGILAEVSEDSIATLCKEILSKWTIHKATAIEVKACDVSAKLATIMEQQAQSVGTGKSVSEEDKKYRDAIVAQYSQVSDNDEDDKDDPGGGASECTAASDTSSSLLVRNTNTEAVSKAEKERRDKAKAEVKEKKAADKANREKQKQQQQERKEKEKKRTQKGERKR